METKKYIIEVKLKREKFSRWYYDKEFYQFNFFTSELMIYTNCVSTHFKYKDIDYFRIIEQ